MTQFGIRRVKRFCIRLFRRRDWQSYYNQHDETAGLFLVAGLGIDLSVLNYN